MNLATALDVSNHSSGWTGKAMPAGGFAGMDAGRSSILALVRASLVDAAAIRHLRHLGIGESGLSREEAEALFALECAATPKIPDWDCFFIEAITDYCVWDLRPTGVVNEAQGEWLIQAADRANTPNAFAVLVTVLEVAHRVPQWFTAAVKARAVRGWPGVQRTRAGTA